METLIRIYGWPHESLHVLALRLLGRRPLVVTRTQVEIPPDLTRRQFVFVAGLPAFVFGLGMALGLLGLLNAATLLQAALALLITTLMGLGLGGTVGDIQLILLRLTEGKRTED